MATGKAFGEHLRALRDARGMSLRDLGDEAGIDPSTISRWENGGRVPQQHRTRAGVIRVAQILGESPEALLRLAGLEDTTEYEGPNRPPFRVLIMTETTLTADQKRYLLGLYDSMVGSGG